MTKGIGAGVKKGATDQVEIWQEEYGIEAR
jgi:hypothetical protein